MKKRIANCPSCGGPIEFRLSESLVAVCDFCHSVVARADKKLEDHGKVADLVQTDCPIKIGQSGQFEKKNFEVTGRVQYQHPAGGVWDEFYLKFPNDRVKWLAYAQGKFYLTSRKRLIEPSPLPDFESLTPGREFRLPNGTPLIVAEKGIATARSASGEIPWEFRPNAPHSFADLHGPGTEFATIEYGDDGPKLFLGREVQAEELGIKGESWDVPTTEFANTAATVVNCPQCAGQLTLRAPDQTLRVCCPNCNSLLDCQQGQLQYLQTLTMKRGEKIVIPLGSVGKLDDVDYTVIGFMERYAVSEGKKYRWSEYLLFNPGAGFRWLVRSSGHWSFVESVPITTVTRATENTLTFREQTYKLFDRGTAYVGYVVGEFYWRVTVGDQVETSDFIAPPHMISFEASQNEAGEELIVSLGTYIEKEVLETAFAIPEIPSPWGVGAIQPLPKHDDVWGLWVLFSLILIVMDVIAVAGVAPPTFSQFHFLIAFVAISLWPLAMMIFRLHFESMRWQNSDFSP